MKGSVKMSTPLRVLNTEGRTAARHEQILPEDASDLLTRSQFYQHLQQTILSARRRNKSLALLLVDLDRFREVNATLGHQWGDVLLHQVGARLRETLGKSHIVARLGGDEFAVLLLLEARDETSATQVAGQILRVLEQPFAIAEHAVDIGASIGIALHSQHSEDAHGLMRRAEVAMYRAKRAGNRYVFYSADYDRYSPDRLTLKADLRHAINHEQLVLHYQPQANLTTGRVAQVEALVRWQHPQHGLMLPGQFIPLAEKTGLIKSLSLWVFNTALRQCWSWRREQIDLCISANLSMEDLHDTHLPDTLARMLRAWNVGLSCLEVEITESVIAADPERTVQVLARLREMGMRIAIDDFGTGYSSLSYLKQLPVHTVKIDKSFVSNMAVDENDTAIVRATIDLGHALGLKVVAEGVENKETYELLAALGCDLAQGYCLSPPLPADGLSRWLQGLPASANGLLTIALPHSQELCHEGRGDEL